MKVLMLALVAIWMGCGSAPEVQCEGTQPVCGAGYFALCEDPGENDAVRDSGGLYCLERDNCVPSGNDGCLDYVGPPLELAPECVNGEPQACPGGNAPICVFMPSCRDEEILGS